MRIAFVAAAMAALLLPAHDGAAFAQETLAARITRVHGGTARVQFDSRAGVCGDGHSMVGYRDALYAREYSNFGHWTEPRCVPGPVRISLDVTDGRVTAVHMQVGGTWPVTTTTVADLGTVDARAASEYFFALVPRLEPTGSHDRVLLPAVLADNPAAVAPLVALARDNARTERVRREAVQWIGLLGDSTVIAPLVRLASDGADSRDGGSERGLGGAAVAALSSLESHVGVPALMQLARGGPIGTRRNAVFWLGQIGDPRGIRLLHTVIEDTHEDDHVRKHAIFSLGNSDEVPPSELAYLRSVYSRPDHDALKESVFQAMSGEHAEGGAWLLQRASDADESLALRKKALFWAGQRASMSTADLVSVYQSASEASLREHAIFVLSQRQDESATDALMHIARGDADSRMRGRALFWLAQKHDPRVTKLIADLVLK